MSKKSSDRITFAVTYNPQLLNLPGVVLKHWRAMTKGKRMKRIFDEPPMVSFRQPPNLKQQLCKVKLSEKGKIRDTRQMKGGLRKCGKKVCSSCPYLSTMTPTVCSTSKKMFPTNSSITCETVGVVYCLTCTKCKQQYIGQTSRRLKDRISEHLGYIRRNQNASGTHFNGPGHNHSHMKVSVLEKVVPKTRLLLETREELWIQEFDCIEPRGMNKVSG